MLGRLPVQDNKASKELHATRSGRAPTPWPWNQPLQDGSAPLPQNLPRHPAMSRHESRGLLQAARSRHRDARHRASLVTITSMLDALILREDDGNSPAWSAPQADQEHSASEPTPLLMRVPVNIRSMSLVLLAALASIFVLSWAKAVFIPLLTSLILRDALSPAVNWFEHRLVRVGSVPP